MSLSETLSFEIRGGYSERASIFSCLCKHMSEARNIKHKSVNAQIRTCYFDISNQVDFDLKEIHLARNKIMSRDILKEERLDPSFLEHCQRLLSHKR